jgi:hypothetical protein
MKSDDCPRSLAELQALRDTLPPSAKRVTNPTSNQTAAVLAQLRRRTREASEIDRLIVVPAVDASGTLPVARVIAEMASHGLATLTIDKRGRLVATFDRNASVMAHGTLTEFSRDLLEHLAGHYHDQCTGCRPSILADVDSRVRCQRCEQRLRRKPSNTT